jgi:hypothetical protein
MKESRTLWYLQQLDDTTPVSNVERRLFCEVVMCFCAPFLCFSAALRTTGSAKEGVCLEKSLPRRGRNVATPLSNLVVVFSFFCCSLFLLVVVLLALLAVQ